MEKTFPLNAALCSHPSLFKRSPPGHEILCVGFHCGGFSRGPAFSPPNLMPGLVSWFLLWRVIGCWESRGREAGIRPQERLRAAWRERRKERVRRRSPHSARVRRREVWGFSSLPGSAVCARRYHFLFSRDSEPRQRCLGFPQNRPACLSWGGAQPARREPSALAWPPCGQSG